MNLHRSRGLAVVLLCSAVLTAACGLKPEVRDTLAQGGSFGVASGGGAPQVAVDTDGDGAPDSFVAADGGAPVAGGAPVDGGAPVAGGAPGPGGAPVAGGGAVAPGGGAAGAGSGAGGAAGGGPGSTSGGTSGATPGGATSGGAGGTTGGSGPTTAAAGAGPGSKVGVDDRAKTIRIALHGPLTGAGVPQESFRSGTPRYFNEGPGGKPRLVKGYRVIAEAFDDQYQAGPAVKACNERAKTEFLLIGGAGADQIQACARSQVLRRGNVPYLSAGVTENGLGGLGNYFATSLTYRQQGALVVKMAQAGGYLKTRNRKGWGVVISNTPNFTDAETAIVAALKAAGEPVKVIRTPKSGGDANGVANQLRADGLESVYFLGQPLFFIQLVNATGCPAYCPQWAGVGVSMGVNSVHGLACQGSANGYKGEFLSPYPGLDQASAIFPGVRFADDIEFGIYLTMAGIEQYLLATPGPSFTRESFIAGVQGKRFTPKGLFPSDFSKGRFGGTGAYALKSDCTGQRRYTTNGKYNG